MVINYSRPASSSFLFLLVATLIYAMGVFRVTSFGNVPLNNVLGKVNLQSASLSEI